MSTLTATQLQQQYIAYFGRPGDPAGIKYWLSSSSGISSAREFADKIYAQDEYKKSTVGTKSTEAQINSLYENLFGREADPTGLIYWTGQIENGVLSLSNLAYDLIAATANPSAGNEVQGAADAAALSNKVAAAEAFTADVEASTSAILAYQPESTDPWVTGAAFESAASYINGITTTAHTDSGVDAAITSMVAANTTAGSTVASTTSKFTTNQDALAGGAGDDIFNGVVVGASATGTTVQPGDSIEGGDGADTLNISFSGAAGAAYTLSAVDTDNVEKILVSNFETGATDATTVSGSLFDDAVTTIGLSSSSASGDTTFSDLTKLVGAEMRNGSGDLTITYDSSVLKGDSDTQTLTVSALTAGTFSASGAETISITSELAKSKLTAVATTDLTTLNISGSANLEIVTALATKTIDASTSTGGVTIGLATGIQTVTGGSGDDVIDGGTVVTKDDVIKGGAGTDTLKLNIGNSTYDGEADDELYGVSEFETIDVSSTHNNATVELDTLWSGVTTLVAGADVKLTTVTTAVNSTAISFDLNGTTRTTDATDSIATVTEAAVLVAATIDAIDGFTATSSGAVVTTTNTGSGVVELGALSGGVNASTTAAYSDITFTDAAGTETLDILSANKVTYNLLDASAADDALTVNLKVLSDDNTKSQTIGDIDISDIETLNLNTSGLKSDYTQTLSNISGDASLATLNITGTNNLTISDVSSDNTKLKTIDASSYTGDLTFSDASDEKQTITTGSGNDSVAFGANLTEDDVIDLGGNTATSDGSDANDTVTATGNLGTSVDDSVLQISNVEKFQLTNNGAAATYIDASKLVNTKDLAFSAGSGTVKLINLPADTTIGVGITTDEFDGTINVALADETGTEDSITLKVPATDAASTTTFKSTGIETLNLVGATTGTDSVQTDFTFGDNAPANIVITKGQAGDTFELGTLNKATTNVNAGDQKGILKAAAATGVGMTISAKAGVANIITTSTADDTITLKGDLGTAINDISTSTGTDVLNVLSLSSTASDFTSVDGVETINITVKNSTTAGFDATAKDTGLQTAKTVNILGGNALSKYVMTTATFDDNTIAQTIDGSTFEGTIELNFASNALDSTVTIKGGDATDDKVTTIIADTANKPASITGVETLVVTSTSNDVAASFDMSNVTGVTNVEATFASGTTGDQIDLNNIPAATNVKVTSTATISSDDDIIDLGYADAASTSTVANLQVEGMAATDDQIDIDAAGVETFNLYNKSGAATNVFEMAGVTPSSGSTTKIVVTGTGGTFTSLNTNVNELDASAVTGAITLSSANRPSGAMTITTSTGADAVAMENPADKITLGSGTDTLTIVGYGTQGGFAVDLSADDQVTQWNGVSNAAVQSGIDSVTGSGVTGTYGVDFTGNADVNTLTGSTNVDTIRGGGGADTIVQTSGVDHLYGGAGADRFTLTTIFAGTATSATVDVIKDFTPGSGGDTLEVSIIDLQQGGVGDLVSANDASSIEAEDTLTTQTITAAYNLDATSAEVLIASHSTAFTTATLRTALVASGNLALTADQAYAADDGFLVIYDDNTDSYLATFEVTATAVTDGGTFVLAKTVVENLVKFDGISDASTFTSGNLRVLIA